MASNRSKNTAAATASVDVSRHPGYVNLGNTCFLNSTLQAISATQSLKQLYLPPEDLARWHDDDGSLLNDSRSAASTPGPSSRRPSLVTDLIDARCRSPVLRLADEEHGRKFGKAISRPPSVSLESSIAALASQAVSNPTPADIQSLQRSDAGYHLTRSDLPLNTAFRQVLEKSWDSHRRVKDETTGSKKGGGQRAGSVNPKSLLNEMSSKYDQYGEYRQQDGHELLRHLLDSLRMEELDVIKKMQPAPPKKQQKRRGRPYIGAAPGAEDAKLRPLVDNLFCGRLLSCVICEGCRHVSHTYEDFYDISLSLRPESEAKETSKRQRIRSFADRWRQRSASGKALDSNEVSRTLQDSLAMLRDGNLGSLSDTEQSDEPMQRSHSRLGRGIGRPKSAADPAKVDANSREGSKTFIKRQVQQSDVESTEKPPDLLAIEDKRREPAFASGGAASLFRAVSGRKTPISRTSSPLRSTAEESDGEKARRTGQHSEHHSISLHHRKKRISRHAQYLSRLLAEATPLPQQNNLGALLWGRRSGMALATPDASPEHGQRRQPDDVIAQQASTGLVRALHHFTSVEVLDGANSFACKRCWRIANPPSTDEHEKLRLRRLRRGKNADDSEMSSDDESSSDEETKERKQKEGLKGGDAVALAGPTSSASSFASLSDDLVTRSRSESLESTSQGGMRREPRERIASATPSLVVSEEVANDDPTPTVATMRFNKDPQAGPINIVGAGRTPVLQAPKPIVASLKALNLTSTSNESSENELSHGEGESDEESSGGAENEGQSQPHHRHRAVRYADEEVSTITKPRLTMGGDPSAPKRKRSMHSIQRRALKRFLIAEPPKVLVFHFKRFQATGRGFSFSTSFRKIDDAITFPDHLDIKPWLAPPREEYDRHGKLKQSSDPRVLRARQAESAAELEEKEGDRHFWGWRPSHAGHGHGGTHPAINAEEAPKTRYRLYAVVVHQGTMSGGHYTAYVLSDRASDALKAMVATDSRKTSPTTSAKDSGGVAKGTAPLSPKPGEAMATPSPAQSSSNGVRVDPLSSVSSLGSDMGGGEPGDVSTGSSQASESMTPVPFAAATKRKDERRWIFASDTQVRAASSEEVLKAQAYMLFYEQI